MSNEQDSKSKGYQLIQSIKLSPDLIYCMAYSPNHKWLITGSSGGVISVWEIASGRLISTLTGHSDRVLSIVVDKENNRLISGSSDKTIKIWDIKSCKELRTLTGHSDEVRSVVIDKGSGRIVSGARDNTIKIWDIDGCKEPRTLTGHNNEIRGVTIDKYNNRLISGSADMTIKIWDIKSCEELRTLTGHRGTVFSVAIDKKSSRIASGSADKTVKIWNIENGQLVITLEGHTVGILDVTFSMDGRLLFSRSVDNTVRIWRTDTYQCIAIINNPVKNFYITRGIVYDSLLQTLFTLDVNGSVIKSWKLDYNILLGQTSLSTHYTNAKVVLLGDSGVGKSGLGLVLSGQPYQFTDSTHGRRVWQLDNFEKDLEHGNKEIREILLWDLAGQPTYRLIHQLHLDEVTIALLVFDGKSEIDPFAGVQYWHKALQQIDQSNRNRNNPIKKFLVAARMDRGGATVSKERIDKLVSEMGCTGYFITSAKEGWSITELKEAICQAIDWNSIAKVVSNKLFQDIKTFWLMCN